MLGDPDLDEIAFGDRGMMRGIDACVDNQCLVSAVSLVYSAIDAIAALTRPIVDKETSGKVFKDWVRDYLHPSRHLGCSDEDLWGARCGILHTYRPESFLSEGGKARPLVYRWRTGPAADTKRQLKPRTLEIVVEDLIDALRNAIREFQSAAAHDADVSLRVQHNIRELLCYRPYEEITIYVVPDGPTQRHETTIRA